jgi:hypothetical protein
MKMQLLAGSAALAVIVGLGLSAAHANPTAKDNDYNYDSDIGNVYNSVYVGIGQDASADGHAGASADYNSYGSTASASAEGWGGEAGYNGAYVDVAVEVGNVAIISENEMYATVTNNGDVYAFSYDGSASAYTGDAKQTDSQQQYAAGLFNNALNTGLGNVQQQGNAVAVNVGTLNLGGGEI